MVALDGSGFPISGRADDLGYEEVIKGDGSIVLTWWDHEQEYFEKFSWASPDYDKRIVELKARTTAWSHTPTGRAPLDSSNNNVLIFGICGVVILYMVS